jgi:DNA modification methylase
VTCKILQGDCRDVLRGLADCSVHCVLTSPPYFGLRDYGHHGQIGLEQTPDEFVAAMVEVFREARRVLRDDGTLWLNFGDSYAGSGAKDGGDMKHSGEAGSRAGWTSSGHTKGIIRQRD